MARLHSAHSAVAIRELGYMTGLFRPTLRVQGREQVSEEVGVVRAVGLGVRAKGMRELVLVEDASVLGEETEQQAGEEDVRQRAPRRRDPATS